jgi:hypothetical protein
MDRLDSTHHSHTQETKALARALAPGALVSKICLGFLDISELLSKVQYMPE